MMRTGRIRSIVGPMLIVLLAWCATTAHAEIAGRPRNDGRIDLLIMGYAGITDGVDPIPQIWTSFRPLPPEWVLNAEGDERGDGRPDIFFVRPGGTPIVVWSYFTGTSYDIAIAHWQGDGWSPVEFITDTTENEMDPRLFVKGDGTIYVVWWVEGPDARVELTSRSQDGDFWSGPVRITEIGEAGLHPTVAFFGNTPWVAYERNATESVFDAREIAVRRHNELGVYALEFIAETLVDDGADPVLHVKPGKLWMDWRYSVDQFAYAEIDDPTSPGASLESWSDPSWIGVESVRRLIAQLVGPAIPWEDPDTNETLP